LLIDALNWLWIIFTAYLTGYALFRVAERQFQSPLNMTKDVVLAAGTAFLTVFSETCSLFNGVGAVATLLLALIAVRQCMLIFRKPLQQKADSFWRNIRTSAAGMLPETAIVWILLLILFVLFLSRSAMQPSSYDDYLYHAQALEWIERYGVVPGLG
jgi:preprotein translocase subunit SecY